MAKKIRRPALKLTPNQLKTLFAKVQKGIPSNYKPTPTQQKLAKALIGLEKERIKQNYIYLKVKAGYNYILAPRRFGKSWAANLLKTIDEYDVINCIQGVSIDNLLKKGNILEDTKIVFDEFESLSYDKQCEVLWLFAQTHTSDWIFLSTLRTLRLQEDTHSNRRKDLIDLLIEKNKIKIFVIDGNKAKKILKLNSI